MVDKNMAEKLAVDSSRDSEPGAEPAVKQAGLAGDTGGIEPVLAQRMLIFEKEWVKVARRGPRMAGARQEAIRRRFAEEFGNNTIRYHQVLSRLLDSPAAEAAEPVLVHRLRAVRDNHDA